MIYLLDEDNCGVVIITCIVFEIGTIIDALKAFGMVLISRMSLVKDNAMLLYQDSDSNHLHCLTKLGVGIKNVAHFQWYLRKINQLFLLRISDYVEFRQVTDFKPCNSQMRCNRSIGKCTCFVKAYQCLLMVVSLKVAMSSPRNFANEATSSTGNMQTHGSSGKRKRSDTNCHQCHKNDKETVVGCTKCKKKYCILCITRWYTTLNMTDVVEACPGCRNICNCAACLKPDRANKNLPIPKFQPHMGERIWHERHVIRSLLPSLKKFIDEEYIEREEEARLQGLPIAGLDLLRSNRDDHMFCNHCQSSILDVHRSCNNCLFKLCASCCVEIRDGSRRANDSSRTVTEWIVNDNRTIVCPPKSLGGCGRRNLALVARYPTNWVSEMVVKAEAEAIAGIMTDSLEVACLGSSQGNNNGNHLHCPTALDINRNDFKHFQWHVQRGEPVVVRDVLSGGTGLSWEPMVMWRACRKPRNPDQHIKKFTVLNCWNWRKETISIHQFFDGYTEGLFDAESQLRILKLEDWPPAESFQEQLPRHFLEFVRCLPFMVYTHPHAGRLNLSTRVPMLSQKPDFGPKMSISYSFGHELGSSSLTMIQYALSDRVSILTHTGAISPELLSRVEKLRRGPEAYEEPEGGAGWDIFRRQDVPKLEEYLKNHAGELKHVSSVQQLVHPVHDQAFYLSVDHKRKLKEECGIEPWTFVQKLGDAIFVPAGCPHQIRYLKSCTSVALNFVAPESIAECVRLSAEYRCLPQNHRSKGDRLQVKQTTLHAVEQAVKYLEAIQPDVKKFLSRPAHKPISFRDHVFMKRSMEEWKSKLEKAGHLLEPGAGATLEKELKGFFTLIDTEVQKSGAGTSSSTLN